MWTRKSILFADEKDHWRALELAVAAIWAPNGGMSLLAYLRSTLKDWKEVTSGKDFWQRTNAIIGI
jgi:hypothetical protein